MQGSYCSSLELLVEFSQEGEDIVDEYHFQKRKNFDFGYEASMFQKFSIPVWYICSVNFLFMTSGATGTGMLTKKSNDIKIY